MMNKNYIIFPDKSDIYCVTAGVCETSCPPQQQEQGLLGTTDAKLLLLVALPSGAAVAVVWARARTRELCL